MSEDRNEKARREFAEAQANRKRTAEMKQAREQFMQAAQAGQAAMFDAIGHRLAPGQLAIFAVPPNVWRWLVKDVRPILDPSAPPGFMRVLLSCDVPMDLPAGQKIGNLLIVGEQEAVPDTVPAAAEAAHPQDAEMMPLAAEPPTTPDTTGHSDD